MKNFLFRLLFPSKYDQLIKMKQIANEIYGHVFDYAVFPDDKGKTSGDYNSAAALAKWNKFHELFDDFRKVTREK